MSNVEIIASQQSLRERIDIHVRLSPHTTIEDFGDLDGEVRRGGYDFYAPEIANHTPDRVAAVEKIAKGDTQAYQNAMVHFDRFSVGAVFRAIFASRIIVLHADASAAQMKADTDLAEFGNERVPTHFKSLDELIAYSNSRAELGARATAKRDKIFTDNLDQELHRRIAAHPRLSAQDKIGVLVTMGDNHLSLPQRISEKGYNPCVSGIPETYLASEEALISYMQGLPVSDELLLEVAANNIIRPLLYHPRTNDLRKIVRRITSTASRPDVEYLLNAGQAEGTRPVYEYISSRLGNLAIYDADLKLEAVPLGEVVK